MRLVIGAVIVYTILSVIYGIVNSVLDARGGEPPLAFLICLMATTCVFIMPPIGSLLLNSVAFIVFNQVSSFSSMYEPNTVFHYWVGWIVVSFVSILRYHECRYGSAREEKIYDASELDELTGLRNRRSLRKDFSKLHGQEFFVAMCDLDDFKHVNDTYGHVEGDFVLRAFSEAIIAMFADDHCYRYGGDEFLVISGCKTQAEFRQRVATMRSMFNTYLRSHGTLPVFPTTSVGYTYGYVSSENELRAMVHVADSNLYKVKQSQKGGLNGEKFKTSSGE